MNYGVLDYEDSDRQAMGLMSLLFLFSLGV